MKTKHLFVFFGITIVFLIFFKICYFVINKFIENKTYNGTNYYVKYICKDCEWDYVKSGAHINDTFLVVIKIKKDDKFLYHQLIFDYNYHLLNSLVVKPKYIS